MYITMYSIYMYMLCIGASTRAENDMPVGWPRASLLERCAHTPPCKTPAVFLRTAIQTWVCVHDAHRFTGIARFTRSGGGCARARGYTPRCGAACARPAHSPPCETAHCMHMAYLTGRHTCVPRALPDIKPSL